MHVHVTHGSGTKLIKFLTQGELAKADPKLPAVTTEEQAIAVGDLLLKAKGCVLEGWTGWGGGVDV